MDMEYLDDDEIQRLIEEQLKSGEVPTDREKNSDAELYLLLFKELKNHPLDEKENQLEEPVVRQIQLKLDRTEQMYYAMSIFSIILLISGLLYGALTLTNDFYFDTIAHVPMVHRTSCLFMILAFCCIQFFDRYVPKMDTSK